jgi:hypothetical protein
MVFRSKQASLRKRCVLEEIVSFDREHGLRFRVGDHCASANPSNAHNLLRREAQHSDSPWRKFSKISIRSTEAGPSRHMGPLESLNQRAIGQLRRKLSCQFRRD